MTVAGKNLNDALVALVRQGIARVEKDQLVEVAKALWYSSDIPDLTVINQHYRRDVCYVIDRLARFNVLPKSRKFQLFAAIAAFKDNDSSVASVSQDPLAIDWGASGDLTRFMPDLLPYQTRHYAASLNHPAG